MSVFREPNREPVGLRIRRGFRATLALGFALALSAAAGSPRLARAEENVDPGAGIINTVSSNLGESPPSYPPPKNTKPFSGLRAESQDGFSEVRQSLFDSDAPEGLYEVYQGNSQEVGLRVDDAIPVEHAAGGTELHYIIRR